MLKKSAFRILADLLFSLHLTLTVNGISISAQPLHNGDMDIIRIILSILLPPLGVFLQVGIGAQFWINILLTLFGYIPGVIHAVYIIASRD